MNQSQHRNTEARMCRQPAYRTERAEFEPLVTPQEASTFLRVHPKTVTRLARQKEIPALRIGKHWRFRSIDLIEWAESQLQSSGQPVE